MLFKFDQQREEPQRETLDFVVVAPKRRDVSKCFTRENGAQFVTTAGPQIMPEWSATSLALQALESFCRVLDLESVACG